MKILKIQRHSQYIIFSYLIVIFNDDNESIRPTGYTRVGHDGRPNFDPYINSLYKICHYIKFYQYIKGFNLIT